ncbi:hypothetical protein PENSTE_c002G05490 [Penicillium steckii]|uniref:Uncharacterized protein n=1 Tax=Penicillium steckii TaxID=303698 RepID=A0A1V6TW13_9EURO|nr:hypothetical protein PENSTE_c002G05490 [Penicillium steckii]
MSSAAPQSPARPSPSFSERLGSPVENVASTSSQFSTANDRITAIHIRKITSLLDQCLTRVGGESGANPPGQLGQSQASQGESPSTLSEELDRLEEVALRWVNGG